MALSRQRLLRLIHQKHRSTFKLNKKEPFEGLLFVAILAIASLVAISPHSDVRATIGLHKIVVNNNIAGPVVLFTACLCIISAQPVGFKLLECARVNASANVINQLNYEVLIV